ncbi:MAG: GTPase Era [Chloroflexi bacterium]|nr:GTPase Era [Chloroflexota bacterium]
MNELPLEEELPPDHRAGFVTLVGRPSVGKSTLLNAYIGQKVAIVSHKPQTTRNRILGILTRPDAQIIFVDTPGIHQPMHKLGEYMVKTAQRAVPDADVVLFLVDVSVLPTEEDRMVAEFLAKKCSSPVILVLNKMDLLPPDKVTPHSEAYFALGQFADWMMISAVRGQNLDRLLDKVIARLPLGPRYYPAGQVTDLTERFIAAELIREQVLHFLHQEVPYAIAVVIEEFKERRPGLTYIAATIYVEKESQKGIVIGTKGEMLKKIGAAAREEIERMLDTKVFLELWVKVRPKWRKDAAALRDIGYGL